MLLKNIEICIPSKGRAEIKGVPSAKLFDDYVIYCPESEAEDYRVYHKRVVGVPDEIKGITATRNFILNNCDKKYIVQCDDDVLGFFRLTVHDSNKYVELDKELLTEVIHNAFVMTEDMGTKLFGFQLSRDKKFYREYSPFSLSSVLVANFFGIINDDSDLRFDERIKLKEDYDFSLMALMKYRKVLRLNMYAFYCKHQTNKGGCVDYRTYDLEKRSIEILKKKWGRSIIRDNKKKDYEIVANVPIKGI